MFKRARSGGALALLAVVAGLMIAACGSSNSSSSASASSSGSSSTSTGTSTTAGRGGGLFTSLTSTEKACLKSHGVTLPTGGTHGGAGGGFRPGGGSSTSTAPTGTPPAGGTSTTGGYPGGGFGGGPAGGSSKFATAFKDCDITISRPSGTAPTGSAGASGTTTKISATALKEFQACVDKHGYDLTSSEINTTGTGSVLSSSLRTNAKFLAAAKDCEQYLQSSGTQTTATS